MKITLIHSLIGGPSGGGGGVRQMLELARALRRLDHEVTVCGYAFDAQTAFTEPDDDFEILSVVEGVVSPPVSLVDAQRQRWRELPRVAELVPNDCDVINAHEMPAHIVGHLAAKRLNKPWVWTRNDASYYELMLMPEENPGPDVSTARRIAGRIFNRADLVAGRSADAITVLDKRNARMVETAYGRDAEIIRSGPALKFFEPRDRTNARAALKLEDSDFLALAVGVLMPYRRFEDLIRAVELSAKSASSARIVRSVIVGSDRLRPDYAAKLRQLRAELNLEDSCELMFDSVPDETLQNLYAAADVFVFPNELQTWGLAPLEALAGGTPVIVSRGAGVHEVLDGFSGVQLVDPRSPEQIANAFDALDGHQVDMSAARDWIRNDLSGTAYAEKMADLMATLIR